MAVRKEDFVLGDAVGEGSFGNVYIARRRDTDERVAMKVMNKQQIVRENKVKYVRNERDVLGRIDHIGVVRILFTFQDSASLFVGMELAEGGELFQQLRARGSFPLELARFYAAEITDVLEYLHTTIGCVHRDLKPENILLTKHGHVKLADFGSSKLLETVASASAQNGVDAGESTEAALEEDGSAAESAETCVEAMESEDADVEARRRGSERRAMSFVGTVRDIALRVSQSLSLSLCPLSHESSVGFRAY